MSKIYCRNCKYCEFDSGADGDYLGSTPALDNFGNYLCSFNNRKKILILPINYVLPDKQLTNFWGNCSYYKRKWWKFWVK